MIAQETLDAVKLQLEKIEEDLRFATHTHSKAVAMVDNKEFAIKCSALANFLEGERRSLTAKREQLEKHLKNVRAYAELQEMEKQIEEMARYYNLVNK